MLNFPRWKILMILSVCLLGLWGASPNFLSQSMRDTLGSYIPEKSIALGLDLQGGLYLNISVDAKSVIAARLDSLSDSIKDLRSKRLSVSRIKMVGTEALSFYYRKAEEKEAILKEIKPLAIIDPSNPFGANQRDFEITEDDEKQIITLTLTEFGVDKRKRDAVSQVISVLGKRIDPEGTKELSIQPSGSDRVILQIPGETNPDQVINLIKTQAKLTFHMVDETATQSDINRGRVKPSSMIVDHYDGDVPIGKIAIERRVMLTGQNLKSAKVTFDQNNTTVVGFVFDVAGGKKFGDITIKYTNKRFAIKLDDRVISSPRINEPILGGSGIITGNYTVDSAQELVTLMNAGALPADLAILEQSTVGPDLGKDSIEAGEKAVIIGFLAVIVYMAISYGLFGLIADVALIANVVIIVGVLTLLQATLTLPGIAGIVLTIGMAVDANVLVFERIREEQLLGRNPFNAMETGYKQAFSTIIDANVTTFIAASLLYFFGSGPVKGFAVTLTVGIITSVFTAVLVTRLILAIWLKRKRPAKLPL